jgi:hypothetical protein
MEDVQAHSNFQHLDKVCLQFYSRASLFGLHEIRSVDLNPAIVVISSIYSRIQRGYKQNYMI